MRTVFFSILFATATLAGAAAENADQHDTSLPDNGLINMQSPYNVKLTADKLEKVLQAKGMTIFKRIDHSAGAKGVGLKLRPTELIIFGNPKTGTALMRCSQTAAIDLPQKALIWQDRNNQVWLSYNDPSHLTERHGITNCNIVVNKISKTLRDIAQAAIAP